MTRGRRVSRDVWSPDANAASGLTQAIGPPLVVDGTGRAGPVKIKNYKTVGLTATGVGRRRSWPGNGQCVERRRSWSRHGTGMRRGASARLAAGAARESQAIRGRGGAGRSKRPKRWGNRPPRERSTSTRFAPRTTSMTNATSVIQDRPRSSSAKTQRHTKAHTTVQSTWVLGGSRRSNEPSEERPAMCHFSRAPSMRGGRSTRASHKSRPRSLPPPRTDTRLNPVAASDTSSEGVTADRRDSRAHNRAARVRRDPRCVR